MPSFCLRGLTCRFNRRHSNRPAAERAGHLNFLTGEISRLFLSCLVKSVDSLMIAIRKNQFTSLFEARKCAVLITNSLTVSGTAMPQQPGRGGGRSNASALCANRRHAFRG